MADDVDVEASWLLELGNALNVAGDLSIGLAGRLRAAPTTAARAAIRRQLREPLRRIVWAAGTAITLLEEGGLDE
jgi:hypothetical protein